MILGWLYFDLKTGPSLFLPSEMLLKSSGGSAVLFSWACFISLFFFQAVVILWGICLSHTLASFKLDNLSAYAL